MKTDELRESYLAFFQSKGCVRKPSDVLVPRDDPTVLFTPAGMNQFKAQFLGVGKLEKRVVAREVNLPIYTGTPEETLPADERFAGQNVVH